MRGRGGDYGGMRGGRGGYQLGRGRGFGNRMNNGGPNNRYFKPNPK